MAKATVQGSSMTPEEYEHAEYVSPRVRRPEVETVTKRGKKTKPVKENPNTDHYIVEGGELSSVGNNSEPDGSQQVENGNEESNSGPQTVPTMVNPSSQEEGAPSTVDSADGTVRQTSRSGKRTPAKKANVRSTNDMDLSF